MSFGFYTVRFPLFLYPLCQRVDQLGEPEETGAKTREETGHTAGQFTPCTGQDRLDLDMAS